MKDHGPYPEGAPLRADVEPLNSDGTAIGKTTPGDDAPVTPDMGTDDFTTRQQREKMAIDYEDGRDNQLPGGDEPPGPETVAPGSNVRMEDGHHVSNPDVLDADADANADSAMPDVEADNKQP